LGELTDLVFVILGKLGSWLNAKGRRVCFVVWAAVLLYWGARNIQLGLMVQTGGCLVSLGIHLYGYLNWKKEGIGK